MGNQLNPLVPHAWPVVRALAIVTFLVGVSAVACAQSGCLVLDPELQGSYEGGCGGGKAEGQGTARGSAVYTGGFHQGKKHGYGVKTWSWGDRYEGGFADDFKHGQGIYIWSAHTLFAGDRYEGGFINDKRNGYGLYTWASGDSYAGPWKDDALTGRATPMMIARFRATNASLEAMAKPGIRLCHESTAARNADARNESETREVSSATRQVLVKVTKVGSTPLFVAGTQAALGDVVWDDPLNWIPCQ
jgi:hypothetical protein